MTAMKSIYVTTLLALLLVAAQSMSGVAQRPATGRTGRELFEQHCRQCHGKDGTRGLFGAANLQTSQLDDQALFTTILNGRRLMPAWGKKLDTNAISLVATYVKTLRK